MHHTTKSQTSRHTRWRYLVALLAVFALVAAACGDSDTSDTADAAGDATTATTSAETAPEATTTAAPSETTAAPSETTVADAPAIDPSEISIGFSNPILRGPPLQAQTDYFAKWADERGYEYTSLDANYDLNTQLSNIDTLIDQGVDILFVWPIDAVAVQPALDRAREQGIAIIIEGTEGGGPYYAKVRRDSYDAGRDAASWILENLGEDTTVAAILGPPQVESLRLGSEGFTEGAEEFGLDIVAEQVGALLTAEEAAAFTDQFREQFGSDLDTIFVGAGQSALPVLGRLDDEFSPLVVTIDAYPELVEQIATGTVGLGIDSVPVEMSKAMAWAADMYLAGSEVPETIWLDSPRVEIDNADEFLDFGERIDLEQEMVLDDRGDRVYLVFS